MNYGIDVNYNVPDLVNWSVAQQQRIDNRAKERDQAYQNLMKMLGRGYGAYKMKSDYDDWKADQAYWDEQAEHMDDIAAGYYDPNDIDIDAALAAEQYDPNDWRNKYGKGSKRYDIGDLVALGLA